MKKVKENVDNTAVNSEIVRDSPEIRYGKDGMGKSYKAREKETLGMKKKARTESGDQKHKKVLDDIRNGGGRWEKRPNARSLKRNFFAGELLEQQSHFGADIWTISNEGD